MQGTQRRIDYASFDSPEHQAWKKHRELALSVTGDASGYRGCFGLALVVDGTTTDSWIEHLDRRFAPDNTLKWASNDRPREVNWSSVRPTTIRFGVPTLAKASEERAWNFRDFPHDGPTAGSDVLSPTTCPQLFRVFNALNLAMTSTAFHFRHDWKPKREALYEYLDQPFSEDAKTLLFGEGAYDSVARPLEWMPKPHLGFPETARGSLFQRATQPAMGADFPPFYSDGLRVAFVEAMGDYLGYRANYGGKVHSITQTKTHGIPTLTIQLRGDRGEVASVVFHRDAVIRKPAGAKFKRLEVIAEERFAKPVPSDWYERNWASRWDQWIDKIIPGRRDMYVRLWFDRQGISLLPGLIHLPAQISSIAALGSAVDGALLWELDSALEYYNTACDACIFPTLQIAHWDQLSGILPGDVHFDLTPTDTRFVTMAALRERVGIRKSRERKAARNWDQLAVELGRQERIMADPFAAEMAEALENERARREGRVGPITARRNHQAQLEAIVPEMIEVTPASEEDRELAIELAAALATEAARKKEAELIRKKEYDDRKSRSGKKRPAPGLVASPV